MNCRLDFMQTNLLIFRCFRQGFMLIRFANGPYTLYNWGKTQHRDWAFFFVISKATFKKTAIKPKFDDWFSLQNFSAAMISVL